ncbi:HD-like signal output (HDOD) protein [Natronocella acetinitrilica]|uniref:HD-like signal output (HDOD) protein n=1 Tax=Natronocella acetinitrilica TaxID=414046 RepID=A0AAE3G2J3_9GAMM|nr:HDOD domain-containing protein [Natronocella acetinitrilica]MCP1674611.1 HD-like signal output (HDOD) protein [Natronocella acetinitrilica]
MAQHSFPQLLDTLGIAHDAVSLPVTPPSGGEAHYAATLLVDEVGGGLHVLLGEASSLLDPASLAPLGLRLADTAECERFRRARRLESLHPVRPRGAERLYVQCATPALPQSLVVVIGVGRGVRLSSSALAEIAPALEIVALAATPGEEALAEYLGARSDRNDSLRAVNQFTGRRVLQRLQDLDVLPPMRETARRLLDYRRTPGATIDHLSAIVAADPALSAQVVSWANAAAIGSRDIRTIPDAISRALGAARVVNLGLGLALNESLGGVGGSDYARLSDYWARALHCAQLSEDLARAARTQGIALDPGSAYLAGLLHNLGEAVLCHLFSAQMPALDAAERLNPLVAPALVQRAVIGVADAQIGGVVADQWELPEEAQAAIRAAAAGDEEQADAEGYAAVVNLALRLLAEAGLPATPILSSRSGDALARRIGEERCGKAKARAREREGEVNELLGLLTRDR